MLCFASFVNGYKVINKNASAIKLVLRDRAGIKNNHLTLLNFIEEGTHRFASLSLNRVLEAIIGI